MNTIRRLWTSKTFRTAVVAIITAIVAASAGEISWAAAITGIFAALQTINFRDAMAKGQSAQAASQFIGSGGDGLWLSPVGQFVTAQVTKILPPMLVPVALATLEGLVREYANLSVIPDRVKENILAEMHAILRKANLIKKTSIPARSIVFLLFGLLVSCGPAVTSIVNAGAADGSSLSYTSEGATFDPGDKDALKAVADVQGVGILTYDPSDGCEIVSEGTHVRCRRAKIAADATWEIDLSCDECSVQVAFERASGRPGTVLPN